MKKYLQHSQSNQDLSKLKFLKSLLLNAKSKVRQLKLQSYIVTLLKRLKGKASSQRLYKALGSSLAGLLILASTNLSAQNFSLPKALDSIQVEGAVFPDLVDMDGDGDLDIVITRYNDVYDIKTGYLENIGDSENFILSNEFVDFELNLDSLLFRNIIPEMGDLDNDVDMDYTSLSYGDDYEIILSYAENLGGNTFSEVTLSEIPGSAFQLLSIFDGNLTDVDNDGDLDILTIGYDYNGSYTSGVPRLGLGFIENTGSVDSFAFNSLRLIKDFPIISNDEEAVAVLEAADFDLDGDTDLLVTNYVEYDNEITQTLYLENVEGKYADPINVEIFGSEPGYPLTTAGDIDGDGDIDVLFNFAQEDLASNFHWLENLNLVSTNDLVQNIGQFSLISNMVSRELTLTYDLKMSENLEVLIIDAQGQLINRQNLSPFSNRGTETFDVVGLSSGNYNLVITQNNGLAETLKFFKF